MVHWLELGLGLLALWGVWELALRAARGSEARLPVALIDHGRAERLSLDIEATMAHLDKAIPPEQQG